MASDSGKIHEAVVLEIQKQQRKVVYFKQQTSRLNSLVKDLEDTVRRKGEEIQALDGRLSEGEAERKKCESELRKRDAKIDSLKRQMEKLRIESERAQRSAKELAAQQRVTDAGTASGRTNKSWYGLSASVITSMDKYEEEKRKLLDARVLLEKEMALEKEKAASATSDLEVLRKEVDEYKRQSQSVVEERDALKSDVEASKELLLRLLEEEESDDNVRSLLEKFWNSKCGGKVKIQRSNNVDSLEYLSGDEKAAALKRQLQYLCSQDNSGVDEDIDNHSLSDGHLKEDLMVLVRMLERNWVGKASEEEKKSVIEICHSAIDGVKLGIGELEVISSLQNKVSGVVGGDDVSNALESVGLEGDYDDQILQIKNVVRQIQTESQEAIGSLKNKIAKLRNENTDLTKRLREATIQKGEEVITLASVQHMSDELDRLRIKNVELENRLKTGPVKIGSETKKRDTERVRQLQRILNDCRHDKVQAEWALRCCSQKMKECLLEDSSWLSSTKLGDGVVKGITQLASELQSARARVNDHHEDVSVEPKSDSSGKVVQTDPWMIMTEGMVSKHVLSGLETVSNQSNVTEDVDFDVRFWCALDGENFVKALSAWRVGIGRMWKLRLGLSKTENDVLLKKIDQLSNEMASLQGYKLTNSSENEYKKESEMNAAEVERLSDMLRRVACENEQYSRRMEQLTRELVEARKEMARLITVSYK